MKNFTREYIIENIETRTDNVITLSVASNAPYTRYDEKGNAYDEVLQISENAIDFSRLVDERCPFIYEHDTDKQLGVVEKAYIVDNKLYVDVRFSENEFPQNVLKDIVSGIRRNTSIGYAINDYTMIRNPNQNPTMLVTKWMPYECSSVSCPADYTVGYSRSLQKETTNMDKEEDKIEETKSVEEVKEVLKTEELKETPVEETPVETTEEAPKKEETKECEDDKEEIRSLGDLVNQRALADKFINEKRTLAEFKNEIKNLTTLNVKEKANMENKYFSITKAIRTACNGNLRCDAEYETSIIEENKRSLSDGNNYDVVVKAENLRALGPSATYGNELINTQYLPGMYTALDRPQTVIDKTGCTIVPVDGNPISFAITLSGCEANMADLDGNLPDTDMRFATKEMRAKKMGACVPIPYSLILQGKPEIDAIVTDDLLKALAQKKDEMALIGSGLSGEPVGVFSTSGVNEVAVSSAFTLSGVYEFEKGIRDANIFTENLAWVMNSKNYYKYATTPKSAVEQNEFLIGADRKLIGYPVYICNALSDDQIVLGDFSELLVANFDGLMLKVDDITYIKKQAIQIVAYEAFDVLVRKPKAFSISKA